MIYVKGYGQMCNNILQYAHIFAWGLEHKKEVVSMRFAYKYRYFRLCDKKIHNIFTYLHIKTLLKLRLIDYYNIEEATMATREFLERLKQKRSVVVDGWEFRNPDLFLKYKEEIKREFAIKDKFIQKIKPLIIKQKSKSDTTLGLHIRRGDYAKFANGALFFDDDVYIRWIKEFKTLFPDNKVSVMICTNDKYLDVEKYNKESGVEVKVIKGNEIEDLYSLSECDYIIGVKSTFSLVAAMYNDTPIIWNFNKADKITLDRFKSFDELFMGA